VTERVKQISFALRQLADALNRRPAFNEISKDSLLHEYLLSKLGALVVEEAELSVRQQEYEKRIHDLGFNAFGPL